MPVMSVQHSPSTSWRDANVARPTEARPAPRWGRRLLTGVLVAVPLGVVLGYMAQPHLEVKAPARPPTPVVQRPAAPWDLGAGAATPATNVAAEAPQAETDGAADQFALPPPPPPLPPLPRRAAVAPPQPVFAVSAAPPQSREVREEAPPGPDCRLAPSWADQMVCEDPELAAAERRLGDAFEQAVAAGITRRSLNREQRQWLRARDEAARDSRQAVRQVYEQRIAELLEIARDAG